MALALPRIRGQFNRRPFPREERLQINLRAADDDLAGCVPDLFGVITTTSGRAECAALDVSGLEGVVQVRAQHRVRADLDKNVIALGCQLIGGLFEANRLAHVAPPVIGGELSAVERGSGDRGVERDIA